MQITTKLIAVFVFSIFSAFACVPRVKAQSPDFTGTISGDPQVVAPGQTARYTITIVPLNGFTSDVALSISGLPVPYTFTPAVVAGGSGATVLSVATDPARNSGQVIFQVTGTSGAISHSTYLTLEISAGGDFSGSVSPNTVNVTPGQNASYTVTMVPLGGFSGNVDLAVSGVPTGMTATFSPPVLNTSNPTSVLTVEVPNGFPDTATYVLVITGTSAAMMHSLSFTLDVSPSGGTTPASPQILKRIKLLNQDPGSSFPTATFFTAPQDGFYRLNSYMFATSLDSSAAGLSVFPEISWTDDSGPKFGTLPSLLSQGFANAGSSGVGTLLLYAKASTPITISSSNSFPTPTSARYSLYITIEGF